MPDSAPLGHGHLATLAEAPLFARLDAADVERLATTGSVRRHDHATLLFSAGDPADAFYAVLAGTVHLFALNEEGEQSLVTLVGPGETFAEAALFGAGLFPVNAEIQAGAVLARFDGPAFLRMVREDQAIGFRMLESLMARQVFLIHEIRRLKAHSPSERLASYLLSLMESGSWPGHGRLPVRKQLIASRIGIEPESLSRALRRLGEAGVECEGDDVTVHDVARLRAFCASFGGTGCTDGTA